MIGKILANTNVDQDAITVSRFCTHTCGASCFTDRKISAGGILNEISETMDGMSLKMIYAIKLKD